MANYSNQKKGWSTEDSDPSGKKVWVTPLGKKSTDAMAEDKWSMEWVVEKEATGITYGLITNTYKKDCNMYLFCLLYVCIYLELLTIFFSFSILPLLEVKLSD